MPSSKPESRPSAPPEGPDLLAALTAALVDIENTAYDPDDKIASLARARLHAARAAIAKADRDSKDSP
jgi:hypothetical protein